MITLPTKFRYSMLATAIAAVAAGPVQAYKSPAHIFSVKDIQRGFDGSTIGPDGARTLRGTICDAPISPIACPEGVEPLIDKDGATLWPIDSAFGFNVVDFLGAQVKTYNGDYQEGYAGDIRRENVTVGLRVSNAATDTYKVKAGWGTWCQGLGGTSVKCSTEHYSVMEHVLSCHETIPYMEADPVTGAQAVKQFPDGSASFNCATAMLDDVLNIIEGGVDTGVRLTDATPGAQLDPNDNTTVLDDIAVSNDYSATLKDDGKVLYRWGSLIKRPKDVRMYAKIPLPAEWKVPGADYPVTSAKLVIKHVVTNNPNDQVRPEDLENEAAIGRLPSYKVETIGEDEVWKSLKSCYEGDGDLIDTEEGANDPTFIGVGTVFKNEPFIVDGTDPEAPLPFSADLTEAFTNAWYTTVDREPFEWSYDADPNPLVQDFVSSPVPNPALGELWSGVHQVRFIKELTEDLSENRLESLAKLMKDIGTRFFSQANLNMALIGDADALSAAAAPAEAAEPEEDGFEVTAPMVGTFYAASSPGAAPYVQVGDRVNEGDTLCIIEAMKMMNQIEADVSGVVKSIRLQNGEPVEFGQTMIVIDQRQND